MVKRLLDANASDFHSFSASDLLESIRFSEGRVVVSEVIPILQPFVDKVSNPELAAAFGADMIILNMYDVTSPQIAGMPDRMDKATANTRAPLFGHIPAGQGQTMTDIKAWIGRPVGLNLEPIENPDAITTSGRLATPENAQKAVEQGADFIALTGNPGTGVTTRGIARSVASIRARIADDSALIVAGKGHAAGTTEPVIVKEDLDAFHGAGADIIMIPAPGTIPGMTLERCGALIEHIHSLALLAMTVIGTSQEGASVATISQIALMSKMAGADLQHIGDAGTIGIATPENIQALSIAIRGRRHTYHRMAASLMR